jgi:hypothetical protein
LTRAGGLAADGNICLRRFGDQSEVMTVIRETAAFLAARFAWAKRGVWGLIELLAVLLGSALSITAWVNPSWTRAHVSDRAGGFLLGAVPLLVGASVFVVRWVLSSFFVFRDLRVKLEATSSQQQIEMEKLFFRCVRYQKELSEALNYHPLWVLQAAGADRLSTTEDLVWLCDELVKWGHPHPFKDLDMLPNDWKLQFLKEARLRGIQLDSNNLGNAIQTILLETQSAK